MDYLLLDTSIVLHLLRNNEYSARSKEAIQNFSDAPCLGFIGSHFRRIGVNKTHSILE